MTRPLKNLCEVTIIGGGIAGLAAARHAAKLGRLVTLFEESGLYGGQIATVEAVDGLGVPGELSGQALAMHLLEECRKKGVHVIEDSVQTLTNDGPLQITDAQGSIYHPGAIIIASGAKGRKLGVPNEDALIGRGVSHCAACDGGFFRGKPVAVIGGGDAAVTEALILSRTSSEVIMVCRSPLRAKREYIDVLDTRENVRFIWEHEVVAITGENNVEGLNLRHIRDNSVSHITCSAVFPYIGSEPVTDFVPASLKTKNGHIRTNDQYTSADKRILAAGAVRDGYGGNIAQAMAEGIGAAEAASKLCMTQKA